jgi:hypothetical protein
MAGMTLKRDLKQTMQQEAGFAQLPCYLQPVSLRLRHDRRVLLVFSCLRHCFVFESTYMDSAF